MDESADSNQQSRRPSQLEQLVTKLLQGIVRSIFFVLKVSLQCNPHMWLARCGDKQRSSNRLADEARSHESAHLHG